MGSADRAVEASVERERRITGLKLARLQEQVDQFEEQYGVEYDGVELLETTCIRVIEAV